MTHQQRKVQKKVLQRTMYSSSPKTKQDTYILIEEDSITTAAAAHVNDPKAPKVVQLRNLAYTPSLSMNKTGSKTLTRKEVLDTLMPLSRSPWGTFPTLINQHPVESKRH
ncbi:hypothetical protein BGX27_006884 [Mortierella sp. AM989]|nr:hypothetical protein BGX27_006884 [Mortierella sp. AM989]